MTKHSIHSWLSYGPLCHGIWLLFPLASLMGVRRQQTRNPDMSSTADEISNGWDAAAMLDALPERVNRYRVHDLAITYCNAAWAAQYNVAPAEAIGFPLDQFLSVDELVGLKEQLALLGPDTPILVDTVARESTRAPASGWNGSIAISPDRPARKYFRWAAT